MHSFTIALISTLSLGVHAASIGDSVSQLVSREQHNRLFHNPDFTSANLPHAESFERSGKISPRKVTVDSASSAAVDHLLKGIFDFDGNPVLNTASTQSVSNGQAFSSLPSVNIGDLLSGSARTNTASAFNDFLLAIDGNTGLNTAASGANVQVAANTEAIIAQLVRAMANAQAAAANTRTECNVLAAYLDQAARLMVGVAANTQVVTNSEVTQATITAQAALAITNARVAAANARVTFNPLVASLDEVAQLLASLAANARLAQTTGNAVAPLPIVNNRLTATQESNAALAIGSFSADVGAKQQDAMKRQLPSPLPVNVPINQATNNPLLNNTVATREDNTKHFDSDDQVEDMDFSVHDSEGDELEEGF